MSAIVTDIARQGVLVVSSVTDIAGQGVIVEQPSTTSSPTGLWSGDFTGMCSYFSG